jgi:hypothetical protein
MAEIRHKRLLGFGMCGAVLAVTIASASCALPAGKESSRHLGSVHTPHPRAVNISLDSAKAVSRDITEEGGTLSATGTDGSTFDLTLPAKAVDGVEKITMTPLAAMHGLSLTGGMQAAVQMEPDGLQLNKAATLTIAPAKPVSANRRIGFEYRGHGEEAFLYPMQRAHVITFKLYHFTGVGIGDGTEQDVREAAANPPTAPEDQAAQDLAVRLHGLFVEELARVNAGEEPNPAYDNVSLEVIQGYYNEVVLPKLDAAEKDPSLIPDANSTALAWLHSAELIGADTASNSALKIDIAKDIEATNQRTANLMDLAEKAAFKACYEGRDPNAALRMMGIEKTRQQLGKVDPEAKVLEQALRCLTFKLDFTTDTTFLWHGCIFKLHAEVKGLLIRPPYRATQPLSVTGVGPPNTCALNWQNVQAVRPFATFELVVKSVPRPPSAKPGAVLAPAFDLQLVIDPGRATADGFAAYLSDDLTEAGIGIFSAPGCDSCAPGWPLWHANEKSGSAYVIKDWILAAAGDKGPFARKDYDRDVADGSYPAGHEKTTFTLTHAPGA